MDCGLAEEAGHPQERRPRPQRQRSPGIPRKPDQRIHLRNSVRPPRQTHLNCYSRLEVNDNTFNPTTFPAPGERARPRVQRVAPRGPPQKRPAIEMRLTRAAALNGSLHFDAAL